MSRFTILAALCAFLAATGCSGRVSHEQAEPSGSSTTTVEISTLDSPPPDPALGYPDLLPPIFDVEGTGNVVVFGDVHHHRHLHVPEDPEPTRVRVGVRVQVDLTDDREQRRRLAEQRLADLLDRK